MRLRHFLPLTLIALVLITAGCGQEKRPSMEMAPSVTGKVTFEGTRPKARVALRGTGKDTGISVIGEIMEDGSCQLKCGDSTNVPTGTYYMSLSYWSDPLSQEEYNQKMEAGTLGENDVPATGIPAKYLDPKQTGWTVTVDKEGGTFDFTVK